MVSAEGGSPKMKTLMKAPRRRTMESWPRRKPWLNESLEEVRVVGGQVGSRFGSCSRGLGLWGRSGHI